MKNLEIREIDIPSPIPDLFVGKEFNYRGTYKDGYEEGFSKIKRFYKEVPFWDNVESHPTKNGSNDLSAWAELENGKLILLGFFGFKNKFRISDIFNIKYRK
ncbi:hypothetical protein [Leptolyngbya phage Lbo-JY46]